MQRDDNTSHEPLVS